MDPNPHPLTIGGELRRTLYPLHDQSYASQEQSSWRRIKTGPPYLSSFSITSRKIRQQKYGWGSEGEQGGDHK